MLGAEYIKINNVKYTPTAFSYAIQSDENVFKSAAGTELLNIVRPSHPIPERGQGEAHWVMPPSSPSSGPLTQGVSIHDAVLHLPIGA